jgi:hypothetical protein
MVVILSNRGEHVGSGEEHVEQDDEELEGHILPPRDELIILLEDRLAHC